MRSVCPALLLIALLGTGIPARSAAGPGKDHLAADAASFDAFFDEGLARFKQGDFRGAIARLDRALLLRPEDPDTLLLLGISCYRRDDLTRAESLLQRASSKGDGDVRDSAAVFLERIEKSQRAAHPILSGSLILSPEFDANVPLADYATWQQAPASRMDGDLLTVGTLTVRPLRSAGLFLSDTLSYRQQLRLQDYNLLLNNLVLGYNHLGDRHRVKVAASFGYAMLGGEPLYLDGGGKASYRLRLWSRLGAALSYDGRYRGYRQDRYAPFTGHSHALGAELSWDTAPSPVSAALGYQVVREQLTPVSTSVVDVSGMPAVYVDDFRAWAHGPQLRLRAALRPGVELTLVSNLLYRAFDYADPQSGRRADWYVSSDLSLNVDCTRWLDVFAGATVIYNRSSDPAYTNLKPGLYAGLTGSFSAF